MVIDTSAVAVILFGEEERDRFLELLSQASVRLMSAANALEAALVVESRKGPAGARELDLLLHHAKVDIVPMDAAQVEEARRIWRSFGKGRHPAGLNYCDCCALALSRISGRPLLFKGEDFVRAGVERV